MRDSDIDDSRIEYLRDGDQHDGKHYQPGNARAGRLGMLSNGCHVACSDVHHGVRLIANRNTFTGTALLIPPGIFTKGKIIKENAESRQAAFAKAPGLECEKSPDACAEMDLGRRMPVASQARNRMTTLRPRKVAEHHMV